MQRSSPKKIAPLRLQICLILTAAVLFSSFIYLKADSPRVLIFSKTAGYKHSSIPFGIAAIQKFGKQDGYEVDTTTNASLFSDETLKNYDAVIFMSTTGNVLNGEQQAAFERYIQAGGGYVGVHAAADTEYDWPWYGKLVGAYFESHPNNSNIRKATIDVVDKNNVATKDLPSRWERTDEWYNYKSYYPDLKVLASLDEESYEGGTNGNHPISWYHDFDGGRSFYTGCGHTDESYSEPAYLLHLSGGIKYAMGNGRKLDYSKAYSKVTPDQNRFVKTVLAGNLNSPMEVATAKDGRIFFTELFGNLSVYNTKTKAFKKIITLAVTTTGGTGLIGLTLDPAFETNNFLYIYYAPGGQTDEPLHFQLSRFTLTKDNTLDLASEKVMLQVPVQKNSGSHHGGSLAWDKEGNLYLSTGDSSAPSPSNGYAPLDERPGKDHYSLDSQRGAGNTNDFKGKILRIHPQADGTYTIPEGNLFPKGMEKTIPEIYIMGCRNPYRIAVNPKTSVLYWGEIGPDAGKDSVQGPKGYDEFNQARKAGNYGWPYFVGNNFAYAKWDFATNTAGPRFDPKAPVNNSPNNTGLTNLPPAMPAFIWYPYDMSKEWPELGVGGRTSIAGAFYQFDRNISSPNKFPEYYDGTLFVADWMRNWVIDFRFDESENYVRNEPFMAANGDFRRPIDMAFGADGILYMLEYGSVYGAANLDARLVKIEYNTGNRPPIAKANTIDSVAMSLLNKRAYLTIDSKNIPLIKEVTGQAPLKVSFTANGSNDLDDDDKIAYKWFFKGKTLGSQNSDAYYTYRVPGIYKAVLQVIDKSGSSSRDTITVRVGNTTPKVTIASLNNKSFYRDDVPFKYSISVKDKEDVKVDPKRIKAYYIYNPIPGNGNSSAGEINYPGKALIAGSDCGSCHQVNKIAVGPSFISIAERYKTQTGSTEKLAAKIISGGGGSWGAEHVMSAHPQISTADASEMIKYIFSLTDKKHLPTPIPLSGTLNLKYNKDEPQGVYSIVASYTDLGGKAIGPLTGTDQVTLRYAEAGAVFSDAQVGFPRFRNSLSEGGTKSYILFKNVDLINIKSFAFRYASNTVSGEIRVLIDSKAGPVISKVNYKPTGGWDTFQEISSDVLKPVIGRHDVYFYAVKPTQPNSAILKFSDIKFK